jgi:hypothetical protein
MYSPNIYIYTPKTVALPSAGRENYDPRQACHLASKRTPSSVASRRCTTVDGQKNQTLQTSTK